MSLVIVHTEVGNIGSVANMCRRIGADPIISSDPEVVEQATKLLLPGVGAFDPAMEYLNRTGLKEALDSRFTAGIPILAICLGMQLLLERSAEGELPGLGWIPGEVRHIRDGQDHELRVTHMGWSPISPAAQHPLFDRCGSQYGRQECDDSRRYEESRLFSNRLGETGSGIRCR